ncbi:MAG: hypothetical protein M4579_002507 [Chaenotheca gracillima]|nr:MAG: hypothetical protein M4579_002507 [Chaenotheca gracillima]
MASWRNEYLGALRARDRLEQVDVKLFQTYTRLADRTAAAEAARQTSRLNPKAGPSNRSIESQAGSPHPPDTQRTGSNASPAPGSKEHPKAGEEELGQIRHDLAEAQRTKTELQNRLRASVEELEKLRAKTKADAQRVGDLTAARSTLTTRVRDRDEELKGKAKLLEDVQDEVISLNIELNMSEKRSKELQAENKDLIARLMTWKGQEADAVNNASKFS